MKYLIVGLGNVGPEYELSRHNIGFSIIDQIAEKFDLKFSIEKHAEYCSFKYKSRNIHLLKPSTFVNNSGKAVNYWLSKLKINNDNLIDSYKKVREELSKYSKDLLKKNELIVFNKTDLIDKEKLQEKKYIFSKKIKKIL